MKFYQKQFNNGISRFFLGFNENSPSRTQISKLRKASKAYLIGELIPQIKIGFEQAQLSGIEINAQVTSESDQDPLIIEINYPYVTNHTKYVKPRVLVEIGIRSLREPFTQKALKSIISEKYADSVFSDEPIEIPTVNVERTFLEKLFLLHEEFQRPSNKRRVKRLSRHLYDIYKISKTEYAERALLDKELYKSIVAHRSIFARMGGVNNNSHFPPNLNPIPPKIIIDTWKLDYATMQEQMIYGESISFDELIKSLEEITNMING